MTRKLYHENSYQRKFRATVLDKKVEKETSALILDQSYFYPNAGGQLCDKGAIEGLPVIDVQEIDGDIIHYIKGDISINQGDIITGEINWESRFDHMQQHSGQHVLSGILMAIWQKETLSFHMGEEICTLDISYTSLDEKKAEHLEEMANQLIYDNKTIHQYYLEDNSNHITEKLRKKQELYEKLRIVEIDKFDLTACGGTHCKSTGEIAIIKIIGWENRKDKTRISFLCGHRALSDYQEKHWITKKLSEFFTISVNQLEEKINQVTVEKKRLTKEYRKLERELMNYQIEELQNNYFQEQKGYRIISRLYDEKTESVLRQISLNLINKQDCFVILGSIKPEPVISAACSKGITITIGEVMKQVMSEFNGRGGGSDFWATGKLNKKDEITQAFNRVLQLILTQL